VPRLTRTQVVARLHQREREAVRPVVPVVMMASFLGLIAGVITVMVAKPGLVAALCAPGRLPDRCRHGQAHPAEPASHDRPLQ